MSSVFGRVGAVPFPSSLLEDVFLLLEGVSSLLEDIVNADFGDGGPISGDKAQYKAVLVVVELELVEADPETSDVGLLLFVVELTDQIVILVDVHLTVV